MWKQKITSLTTWRPTLRFNFRRGLSTAWEGLLHVLLPRTCYSCRRDLPWRSRQPLCVACEQALRPVGPLYCVRCGKPLPDGGAHCYSCRGSKARQYVCKVIRSALVFDETLRPLIHAFKYSDQAYLGKYLAQWLHTQWSKYPDLQYTQLIIPVPLHPKKQKQRGYNQSQLLAEALGRLQGLPVDSTSLVRVRNTPSQTGFGREGRMQNMKDAFQCVSPQAVRRKVILLIDDVATTGATLESCAQALKAAGAQKVMAYTLAREV